MNAASRPLQRMKRFRLKEFLIGSWCFHSAYGEAYCRAYKGAGFNTMVDAPCVLDDALKTGRFSPDYVILVNKRTANAGVRQPRARTARVTFGPAVKKTEVLGRARPGSVSGRTASVKLRAGDGVLLKIDCPRALSF